MEKLHHGQRFCQTEHYPEKRFKEKKYPKSIVKQAFEKANLLSQEDCVRTKPKEKLEDNDNLKFQNAFITTYNHECRSIQNTLRKHWYILQDDPYLQKIITSEPTMIYRRAKTLKSTLAPGQQFQ